MFVEGAKNGNYRSVSIAHSLRGAFFLGGAAPAIAGAGFDYPEEMVEVLVYSFASVFVSGSPRNPYAHQRCEEQMEPMQVT